MNLPAIRTKSEAVNWVQQAKAEGHTRKFPESMVRGKEPNRRFDPLILELVAKTPGIEKQALRESTETTRNVISNVMTRMVREEQIIQRDKRKGGRRYVSYFPKGANNV